MNIDPSGLEKNSDQTSTWSDNILAINSGHVRSYRCSFCKRGFSNAQALGGHMNIHRKDRAKLKEFSHENLLSLDITKTTDFSGDSSPANSSASEKLGSEKAVSDGKVEDFHDVVSSSKENSIRRLPLFAEAPSVSDDDDDDDDDDGGAASSLEKNQMELIHGEVDLELRLGPEPHDAKINQRV